MKKNSIVLVLLLFYMGCGPAPNDPSVPLEAEFRSDRVSLVQGQQVTFQDAATGVPTSWSWTFEGGTPSTSDQQNPVITYNTLGRFQVGLTVSRDGESKTITKENFINVIALFDGNTLPNTSPCKLSKVFTNDFVDLGFPNNGPAPALGTINIPVLFADFSDAPSSRSTTSVFELLDPINKQFYEEMSYGRLEVNLVPYHSWLHLSQPSTHYASGLRSASGHLEFIQEAVDLADSQVDFSDADIVLVMSNPDASEIGYGPAFGSLNDDFSIKADGNSIRTGITSGFDLNNWGGIWLAHEMGHSLGLHDLYSFSGSNLHRYVGTFGMMGLISGKAPGFFAYERWLLGWLDDDQIYCHTGGSIALEIQEIATSGGLKAVLVPLSDTKAVMVESRKKTGFDATLSKEGVLVYVVDTSIERGGGPIQIRPNANLSGMKEEAPMVAGDVYTYEGVRIEVVESKSSSDVVLVSVE